MKNSERNRQSVPLAFWMAVRAWAAPPFPGKRTRADLQADLPQISWAADRDGGSGGDSQPLVTWAWPPASVTQAVTCGWLQRQGNVSCFQMHTAGPLRPAPVTSLLIYIESGCNSTHRRGWPWIGSCRMDICNGAIMGILYVFFILVSMQHWCLEMRHMLA